MFSLTYDIALCVEDKYLGTLGTFIYSDDIFLTDWSKPLSLSKFSVNKLLPYKVASVHN